MRLAHGEGTYGERCSACSGALQPAVLSSVLQTKRMNSSTTTTSIQWRNCWGSCCTSRWGCCSPLTKGWSSYWRTVGPLLMRTERLLPAGTSLLTGESPWWIEFQTLKNASNVVQFDNIGSPQICANIEFWKCVPFIPVAAQTVTIATWQPSTPTVGTLRISNASPWTCSPSPRMTRFCTTRWAGAGAASPEHTRRLRCSLSSLSTGFRQCVSVNWWPVDLHAIVG